MERWSRFGSAIGTHMSLIAPVCVLVGVMFPEVFGVTERAVPVMFAIMTFQGSLNNNLRSVAEVFRHPTPMLAMLFVTMVLMPVGAHALGSVLFAGSANIVTGITLEYCVPVAVVSFMWQGMYGGNGALSLATVLVSTLLAPFTIPLTLKVLLGATVAVDVVGMMTQMVFMIALPALAGMVLNEVTDGWGHRTLSPAISPAVRVLLVIIITSNSTQMSDYMRHLTPELFAVMGFIVCFAAFGFTLGILLARAMRVSHATLVSMCFGVGMRNISAGAVIAAQFFPGEVVFPVMMGTLFQQVLASLFGTVMGRMSAPLAKPEEAEARRSSAEETTHAGEGARG